MQKILPKKELNDFLKKLLTRYELIAPVKKDNSLTKFEKVNDPKEIFLDKITRVPIKKLFIPDNEVLIDFKKNKQENIRKKIIFGLRRCDLNALRILDKVMFDELYKSKRNNSVLIGLFCENPDDYCFCNSMELEDYYDLFFYPEGINYFISIGSKKGEALVKHLKDSEKMIIKRQINHKVLTDKKIERHYRNKVWESEANKCLSCSACTIYCPTCNCFDIRDSLDISLKGDARRRSEMSCQLLSFSRIAGGKSIRSSRLARFKHFIYHKLVYFKKKKGRYMCVGCGRCLRSCPPKIDWVETINLLEEECAKKK